VDNGRVVRDGGRYNQNSTSRSDGFIGDKQNYSFNGGWMRDAPTRLKKYADLLATGVLSVTEAASAVLHVLAESTDCVPLWADAPVSLREPVLAYLVGVGLDGLPPVFMIGPTDPVWRASQTVRRREVAAKLLADTALSSIPLSSEKKDN
jgi:hypothetical protein